MNFIKLSTLQYPLHEGDIRLEYPEIPESATGGTFPCPPSYALVNQVDEPSHDISTQVVYQIQPQQIDGQWYMVWEVRDRTQEELELVELANSRSLGMGLSVERL
jgi:hypothetical protein